jgi:hypothetical protein
VVAVGVGAGGPSQAIRDLLGIPERAEPGTDAVERGASSSVREPSNAASINASNAEFTATRSSVVGNAPV